MVFSNRLRLPGEAHDDVGAECHARDDLRMRSMMRGSVPPCSRASCEPAPVVADCTGKFTSRRPPEAGRWLGSAPRRSARDER